MLSCMVSIDDRLFQTSRQNRYLLKICTTYDRNFLSTGSGRKDGRRERYLDTVTYRFVVSQAPKVPPIHGACRPRLVYDNFSGWGMGESRLRLRIGISVQICKWPRAVCAQARKFRHNRSEHGTLIRDSSFRKGQFVLKCRRLRPQPISRPPKPTVANIKCSAVKDSVLCFGVFQGQHTGGRGPCSHFE